MARKSKIEGFSMDNIVDTMIKDNINDKVNDKKDDKVVIKKDDKVNDNKNILEKLKQEEPEKVKLQLYFDKDVNNLLEYYGKKVGKAAGGRSAFANEIMKRFLQENNLWIDKVANKK